MLLFKRDIKIFMPNTAKAVLFAGIMYADHENANQALELLTKNFGETGRKSREFDFSFTNYYEEEMGKNLKKFFVSFKKPVEMDSIAEIKTKTINIEKKLARDGKRTVNIDPGCITPEKCVLATTKDRAHRIYLGKGIFGEVTFMFRKNDLIYLPWTYEDFKTDVAKEFFVGVKKDLKIKTTPE